MRTLYLIGCDGAHSTVRKGAGIPFEGDAYQQDFMFGDVEADGPLEPDTLERLPRTRGHRAVLAARPADDVAADRH